MSKQELNQEKIKKLNELYKAYENKQINYQLCEICFKPNNLIICEICKNYYHLKV
jgi:hypothetical protein